MTCDCGGWSVGTHSDWCSDPKDNERRPKGLEKPKPAEKPEPLEWVFARPVSKYTTLCCHHWQPSISTDDYFCDQCRAVITAAELANFTWGSNARR